MTETVPDTNQVLHLALDDLMPDPNQPRRTFPREELERLRASVAARGVLQPLRVAFDAERQKWRIILGETRWHHAQLAGLATVPCLATAATLSETEVLSDQIIENTCRNALKPLELARSVTKLKALMGATSQQIGKELGLSGAAITRAEALLRLPEDIQALVDEGRISESAAYSLSRLDDESEMRTLAAAVASGKMTRDQVAKAVQDANKAASSDGEPAPANGKAAQLKYKQPDSGVSITISGGGKPLTVKTLRKAIDSLRQAAGRLNDDSELSELVALLQAP